MFNYLYMAASWSALLILRVLLILIGILLSPLIMLTRKPVPGTQYLFTQYHTNREWELVLFHPIFWIWSNGRDGVQWGDTRGWYYNYAREKGWSEWMMAWHWAFIRNPTNNLRWVRGLSAYMPEVYVTVFKGQDYVDDKVGNEGFQILKGKGRYFNYYTLYYVTKANDKGISPWIIRLGHKIKISHNTTAWNLNPDDKRGFKGFKGMTFRINRNVDIS